MLLLLRRRVVIPVSALLLLYVFFFFNPYLRENLRDKLRDSALLKSGPSSSLSLDPALDLALNSSGGSPLDPVQPDRPVFRPAYEAPPLPPLPYGTASVNRTLDNFPRAHAAHSAADLPPIPAWRLPRPRPFTPPAPLYIAFTRNWRLLQQCVVSYITAGWPPAQIFVVENTGTMQSNARARLSIENPFFLNHTRLHMLGVNVLVTPTLMTFAQTQNFFLWHALDQGWDYYFWSHMDVAVLSYEESHDELADVPAGKEFSSLYDLALDALLDTITPPPPPPPPVMVDLNQTESPATLAPRDDPASAMDQPDLSGATDALDASDAPPQFASPPPPPPPPPKPWGIRFFAYDWLTLVNAKSYDAIGGWDPLIPYYTADCDFHFRLRDAGYDISDARAGHIIDVADSVDDLEIFYRQQGGPPVSFAPPQDWRDMLEEDRQKEEAAAQEQERIRLEQERLDRERMEQEEQRERQRLAAERQRLAAERQRLAAERQRLEQRPGADVDPARVPAAVNDTLPSPAGGPALADDGDRPLDAMSAADNGHTSSTSSPPSVRPVDEYDIDAAPLAARDEGVYAAGDEPASSFSAEEMAAEENAAVPDAPAEPALDPSQYWVDDTPASSTYHGLHHLLLEFQVFKGRLPRLRWQGRQSGGENEPYHRHPDGFQKGLDMIIMVGKQVYSEKWGHRGCNLEDRRTTSDAWNIAHDETMSQYGHWAGGVHPEMGDWDGWEVTPPPGVTVEHQGFALIHEAPPAQAPAQAPVKIEPVPEPAPAPVSPAVEAVAEPPPPDMAPPRMISGADLTAAARV